MIVQSLDNKGRPIITECAYCGGEFESGDTIVEMAVYDTTMDEDEYMTKKRDGQHPLVHYSCISREMKPVVVNLG